jgi:trimethylamine--corrinoid protein Co-methyltransferase
VKVFGDDQLEAIHVASLCLLEEGLEFLSPAALDRLAAAGAGGDHGHEQERIDRGLELLAKLPSRLTLHACNPDRDLEVGGKALVFCAVSSSPNRSDRGQRPPTTPISATC